MNTAQGGFITYWEFFPNLYGNAGMPVCRCIEGPGPGVGGSPKSIRPGFYSHGRKVTGDIEPGEIAPALLVAKVTPSGLRM